LLQLPPLTTYYNVTLSLAIQPLGFASPQAAIARSVSLSRAQVVIFARPMLIPVLFLRVRYHLQAFSIPSPAALSPVHLSFELRPTTLYSFAQSTIIKSDHFRHSSFLCWSSSLMD